LANEQAGDNAGCVFQKPKSGHSVDLQTGLTTHAGVINPDLLAFIKGWQVASIVAIAALSAAAPTLAQQTTGALDSPNATISIEGNELPHPTSLQNP
jgi:hypothetical protein